MGCTRRLLAVLFALGLLGPGAWARADAGLSPTAQAGAARPWPPPRPLGPPPQPLRSLSPQQRQAERQRLLGEIQRLRDELHRYGEAEADRRDPDWWDLPARRGQQRRLRQLVMLRSQLERRQRRLARLDALEIGPAGRDMGRLSRTPEAEDPAEEAASSWPADLDRPEKGSADRP